MDTIINSDLMFEEWDKIQKEIRRACMGKYIKTANSKIDGTEINFKEIIPKYCGESICHNKFNYQLEGNKCSSCNTLSYLFRDGNIIYDAPFQIQAGKHKDESLIITKYIKSQTYGKYTLTNVDSSLIVDKIPQIELCNNSFNDIISIPKIINNDLDVYHYISCCCMLNYIFEIQPGVETRFLNAYICDNINVIKVFPNSGIGTFNPILEMSSYSIYSPLASKNILSLEVVNGIFKQLIFYFYFLSKSEDSPHFLHGSPSMDHLSFDQKPLSIDISLKKGSFSIKSPFKLYIEPGKFTSIIFKNYFKEKYQMISQYDDLELRQVTEIPISFSFSKNLKPQLCISSLNPCLPQYLSKRTVTYTLTSNSLSCIRNSGYCLFPSLDLYLFITSLLCEECFYITFVNDSKLNLILRSIILPEQYDFYIENVIKSHRKDKMNADQIASFIISIKLKMKCNIIDEIWELLTVV